MNRFAGVAFFLMSWTLPLSNEAATLETPMVSISGEAQGTTYQIKYFDGQNRNFKVQIDSILTEFDKSLSNYRKDSEIAEFNKSSSLTFRLPYFYPVLKKSQEMVKNGKKRKLLGIFVVFLFISSRFFQVFYDFFKNKKRQCR